MDKVILSFEVNNMGGLNDAQSQILSRILSIQLYIDQSASRSNKIAEGVLMIHLQEDLPHFASVVSLCQTAGFPYKVLYLKEDQEFIHYPPKPAK